MPSNEHQTFGLPRELCERLIDAGPALVGLVVVITSIFALKVLATPMSGDPLHAFLDDETLLREHTRRSAEFGSDSGKMLIVITDEGESLFTTRTFEGIRGAAKTLESTPNILSVTCLTESYRSAGTDRRLSLREVARRTLARNRLTAGKLPGKHHSPELLWPRSESQQAKVDFERLRAEILGDSALVGKLVTADGRHQAMMIILDPEREYSTSEQEEIRQRIEAVLDRHNLGTRDRYLIGLPVMNLVIVNEMRSAVRVILPACVLLLGVTIYAVFGQIKVVIVSLVLGLIAVVWGVGATAFLFGELTILVAAAPVVVLAVSTADFIHLTSAYQKRLAAGRPQRAAVVDVFSEVGGACVLTSVTTFVGFGALVLVASPTVRHFGFAIAFGSAVALLLVIGLLPYIFAATRRLNAPESSPVGHGLDRVITRLAAACNGLSRRYPTIVFAACVVPCLPAVVAIASKPIEADVPGRFPPTHEWNRSLAIADHQLSGSHFLELFVTAPASQLSDPATIAAIALAHDAVTTNELVQDVSSIISVYRAIDNAVGYQTENSLPPSALAADTSIEWVRGNAPKLIQSVTNLAGDELRIRVMVGAMGFRALHRLAEELEWAVKQQLPAGVSVEWGGTYPLVGSVVSDIVYSQIRGFALCVVSLTVIMMCGLRSIQMGGLSQIPNLIPVLLMVGLVAVTRHQIDSDMLGLPMIALGLAVDDTIHFLHRFRHARLSGHTREGAVDQAFESAGRSIIISTIALCLGLLPLALSSFLSLWMLGTYLVAGLAGAVIADLLCLPAMIHLGWINR